MTYTKKTAKTMFITLRIRQSEADRAGDHGHGGHEKKGDRHSKQDPLTTRTPQTGGCSSKEQDQGEQHGEDGVVVPTLVELERISEAGVGALVRGRGLGRTRWHVLLHLERTARRLAL